MMRETLQIIIMGNTGQGKSSLIGRLLFETGSFPKEKTAEIKKISKELGKDTELAFIIEQLQQAREINKATQNPSLFFTTKKRYNCIIDPADNVVLMEELITGTKQAQAAVLVTEIHQNIQEQTKHSIEMLKIFGIKNIIVLFNKMDLIDYDREKFREAKQTIESLFSNYSLVPFSVIPISAKLGVNIVKNSSEIPWYKGLNVSKALDSIPIAEKKEMKPFRFPVQDIYTINGTPVIVGIVASGSIQKGDRITIYPEHKETSICEIKVYNNKNVQKACQGETVGLIPDKEVPVKRGDVFIRADDDINPVKQVTAFVFWMSDLPLEEGNKITLCCATQEVECIVKGIEDKINPSAFEKSENNTQKLERNEAGKVNLHMEHPVVCEESSFIAELGRLLFKKDNKTTGAGIILKR